MANLGEEQVNGMEDVQVRSNNESWVPSWYGFQEGGDDAESNAPSALEGGSENATGMGIQEEADNLSDDISDTGWDTDLDLEGLWEIMILPSELVKLKQCYGVTKF